MEMVANALEALGAEYVFFNQRRVATAGLDFETRGSEIGGVLTLDRVRFGLADISAAYVRLMDDGALPEVRSLPSGHPARRHCRGVHTSLQRWLELSHARVVNRAAPQGSNASKPYQLQLIAGCGLRVPETLVTNDPRAVIDFRARHGRVIFKSISGARSIVRELSDQDVERLPRIRWCPVQFQEHISGHDVRVHCVGDHTFATAVRSAATDYRYAHADGHQVDLAAIDLADDVVERCVAMTRALGLEFAGIDLRVAPNGDAYCLEVNPSPAFSYYEDSTGQPIAAALAAHLAAA
jgi:glutathione synthase/RimK-type ligase-like ATP-grasp enzyme